MWFEREIAHKLTKLASQFPAVVLTGARQTGKTSLLRRLFPNHTYVSLDVPRLAAMAEQSPEAFLEEFPPPILIDEVQYAPLLFRHLKIAIDANRHCEGQFILTGSQKFVLMKEVSDSLAGRCAVLELETLSGREIHPDTPVSDRHLQEQIVRGGFPDLWRRPDINPKAFFDAYLATYLERDVRQLINVVNLRDFERFIRACATRTGQVVDKTSIAADVGVRSKTINDWLSVLVASNQIALLEPWFGNFGKRLVKTPKMYFCDTGFACYFLGINEETLTSSPFLGALWETWVFSELRKTLMTTDTPGSMWFYRDKSQVEIDFLYLGVPHNFAIECKWHEVPTTADFRPILQLQEFLEKKPHPELANLQGRVLCRTTGVHPFGERNSGVNMRTLQKELGLD